MAAEISANAAQDVLANGSVIFTEMPVPCPQGNVVFRDGSGLVRLANKFFRQNIMSCWRRKTNYKVSFNANLGLPATGGTPGPLQLAVFIDGEMDPSSIMQVEAAANPALYNVGADVIVQVPYICSCSSVSVRNISNQTVTVANANLVISPA